MGNKIKSGEYPFIINSHEYNDCEDYTDYDFYFLINGYERPNKGFERTRIL